ncbi:MAG: hypothetical protein GXP15_07945 [Gammaproteobacteria bacterium]|nr:hypothetical protein [Gammaproteobacteria bacterium]
MHTFASGTEIDIKPLTIPKALLFSTALLLFSNAGYAADQVWQNLEGSGSGVQKLDPRIGSARHIVADMVALRALLLPTANRTGETPSLTLPMPDGRMLAFSAIDSPIMAPQLASKFPQIKTYAVRAITDTAITGRIDIGPNGFHALLQSPDGSVFIDPARVGPSNTYISFLKQDYTGGVDHSDQPTFSCRAQVRKTDFTSSIAPTFFSLDNATNDILVYRLAAATTGEYSQAVAGGDAVNTLAEVVTAINRLTQIFERDLGIRMLLVAGNDGLIYTDPSTDPYSNADLDALLVENQSNIDDVIGSANYDIGHVFSTSDGGLANINAACDDSLKAGGATGLENPVGDAFYIDYLAHELGHQFGADHSFNGTTALCGDGNRYAPTAFEPGSGSTIMSYGGICDEENVQEDPDLQSPSQGFMDPTFHAGSIAQVNQFVRSGFGATCPASLAAGNVAPSVDAGPDYVIPAATPFTLTGTASDANNGDVLLHQWDQMDLGFETDSTSYGIDLVTNPLFRSFVPVPSASRTFPRLPDLLDGTPDKAEALPVTSRTMNFRLTVRDGNGGVNDDAMQVSVDNEKGPFVLLQPNTAVTLNTMANQVVEWNAACTELAPISCNNVDILWSTDSGTTFLPLAVSVANDGEQLVTFPATSSSTARLMLTCSDNVFFDVSDTDFSLAQDGSGLTLAATGNGGSSDCGTGLPMGDDPEPNDAPADAQAITAPFSVDGTANSDNDVDDYFVFTVPQQNLTYTINLTIPANAALVRNNHDIFLLDESGTNVIEQSAMIGSVDESISRLLSNGATYYIRVRATNTVGQNSAYTLSVSNASTPPPSPPPVSSGGGGGAFGVFTLLVLSLFSSFGWRRSAAGRVLLR